MEEYAVGVIDGVSASWGACVSASVLRILDVGWTY